MTAEAPRVRQGCGFPVDEFLEEERAKTEEALSSIRGWVAGELNDSLCGPLLYALDTRGKRIRPILCAASYTSIRGGAVPKAVYRLATALEVVHTYSLVHDDLPCMDDDAVRRGRPTVHRVHGVAAATLAGAALLPLAVRIVARERHELGLHVAQAARVVVEICTAAGAEGMVGGQLLDLEGERRVVSASELESIHSAKTGALLTASLRVGAIAAGCDDGQLEALSGYGRALGIAFQITDDILDVVGDSDVLGKSAGRDEALEKSTYPALFGIDGARALAVRRAEEAVSWLEREGISSDALTALAHYVVERSG